MPIFEYECSQGHVTEDISSVKHKTKKCEECGRRAKRIMSSMLFQFVGGVDGYIPQLGERGAPLKCARKRDLVEHCRRNKVEIDGFLDSEV